MNLRQRQIFRVIAVLALALSLAWLLVLPGFEPLITALMGLGGLLSARGGSGEPVAPGARSGPGGTSAGTPRKSIVVLPFDNLSPDPDDAYFSDGLSEELITDLSKVSDLRVISRTSARLAKESGRSLREIGADLEVRYVLAGGVRKSGDDFRITVQLLDAENDAHLWADRYDGVLGDVFDFQAEVSKSIVESLGLTMALPQEETSAGRSRSSLVRDPRAYDCYVRAREEVWRCTRESLDRAVLLLGNGLRIVGEHASLQGMLGQAYWQYINMAIHQDPEFLTKAEEAAVRALELDDGLALGHLVLGEVEWKRGRMAQAIGHMEHALRLDPNDPDALLTLAYVYSFVGRSSAGRPLIERLISLDPLNPLNYGVRAYVDLFDGRKEAALESSWTMFEMDPESPAMRWIHTVMLAWNDRVDDSPWDLAWARNVTPQSTLEALCKVINLAVVNDTAAVDVFTADLQEKARWDEQYSWLLAACYAKIGEVDLAMDWLENAVHRGFLNFPFLSADDPFLENLRTDSRFQALMKVVADEWRTLQR